MRIAENGKSAIDVLETWIPDAIVLDMLMPVMDGRAFRAVQLAKPEWREIPVIVVSATKSFLEAEETFGAKAVLSKPFDFDELLVLLDSWAPPNR